MRILLTGSSGFTGQHFLKMAHACGHSVVSLSADITDISAVREQVLMTKPEAVIHLAAISFVGHSDAAALYAVNVVGSTNLLSALSALTPLPRRVLLVSSANVYGNCLNTPIGEGEPPSPVNHYAMSKLAMEYMARTYCDQLPILIARPFNYTGPGQANNFIIPKLVEHYVGREPIVEVGDIKVAREFNDVRTVCECYLALLEYGDPGEVYNICSGQAYSIVEVMDLLCALTGHAARGIENPALTRTNEIARLCGDPSRMNQLLRRVHGSLQQRGLPETLRWMLDSKQVSGRQ